MKTIATLPNLLTLANAACGFLAISKAIDALSIVGEDDVFYSRMKFACFLVFLAMIFDGSRSNARTATYSVEGV